jgi:ATP-binding cassette subfamily B protein
VSGALAGALYVVWIILLILFVQLLLDEETFQPDAADREHATTLVESARGAAALPTRDAGLLPAAVATRERWIGPILGWLYRTQDWTHRDVSYLTGLLGVALIVGALRLVLLYIQNLAASEAVADAVTRLRRDLVLHRSELGSLAFDPLVGAPINPLLRSDVPLIQKGLHAWLATLAREATKSLLLLALVLVLNPFLGLSFVLLAALLWVVGSWALVRILNRRKELVGEAEDQLEQVLSLADSVRLIKGYAADVFFEHKLDEHLRRLRRLSTRRLRYEARLTPYWQFSGLTLVVLVFGLGAQNVLTGKFALSEAIGVCAALASLAMSGWQLVGWRQGVLKAAAAADRVFQYMDQTLENKQRQGARFLQPPSTSIDLERVSYADPRGRTLIDNLSIRIHAGQRIALVARSDAEKRAFVFLLTRFIDPTQGSLRIDGVDLRDVTLESLRAQVCLVLESDLLFPDAVANNIGLGDPGYPLPRIIEAAKTAHAHHFISKLPKGYECVVGQGGFPLKPGESYRIALARAILRDPPVVVIEEPRRNLDDDTKAALDDTMSRFLPGRTVIMLPHRLSTIRSCDQIFLLDQGKLVSCGSHRELLETSELYRHLQYVEHFSPPASA